MENKILSKILLLVTLSSILILYWFFNDYAIISQEHLYFIDIDFLNNYADNSLYVWNSDINNGVYTFLAPFNSILLYKPLGILARMLNYENMIQFLSFISLIISIPIYYLCFNRYFKNKILFLFSSSFYILNPWILERVISGHTFFIITLPLYPLIIHSYLRFLEKLEMRFLIFAYFLSFPALIFTPQFYIIIFLIFNIIVVYNLLKDKKFRTKKFVANILFFYFLMIFPFIINYIYANGLIGQTNVGESFSQDIKTIGKFQTLINIFTLTSGQLSYAKNIYDDLRIFYLLPIFGIIVLLLNKEEKKVTIIVSMILLAFTIDYYSTYINIPLFRDLTKFLFVYVLLLPYIIFYLFDEMSNKICCKTMSNNIIYGILILFIILGLYPYVYNHNYLDYVKMTDINRSAYEELNNLEQQEKILFLPYWQDTRYIYNKNDSLTMTDFLQYNSPYRNIYYTYNDFNSKNQKLLKIRSLDDMKKFNIRYVIFRKDLALSAYLREQYFINLHKILAQDSNLVLSNDYFDVYELGSNRPIIEGVNISYQKINPTKYRLFINNLKSNQSISFFESFHEGWKLYISPISINSDCQKLKYYQNNDITECRYMNRFFEGEELSYIYKRPIFDDGHKLLDKYANSWTIDPEYIKKNYGDIYYNENSDGGINIELTLYFKPQSYFYVMLIAIGMISIICIGYLVRNLKIYKTIISRKGD